MKKSLLSLALVASAAIVANAETPHINFGYCGDGDINGIGVQKSGIVVGAAIEIPAAQMKEWSGNKIGGLSFAFGSSGQKNVTIFVSDNLSEPPYYSEDVVAKTERWNEYIFDTPLEITGETIYVGYFFTTKTTQDYALGFDGNNKTYSQYGGKVGMGPDEASFWGSFQDYGDQFGNACIRIRIEGENLPKNVMAPTDFSLPAFAMIGEVFNGAVTLVNLGANSIENFEIEYNIGTATVQSATITPAEPIAVSGKYTAELSDLMFWQEDFECPVNVRITKVNGVEMENPVWVSDKMIISNNVYKRTCVIEEGTGTWCGWCPRGYVGMEEMKEKYGNDNSYIGIAIHVNDAMTASSYGSMASSFFTGYPSAAANRAEIFDPDPETCQEMYDTYTNMVSFVGLDVYNIAQGEEEGTIDIEVRAIFGKDMIFDSSHDDYGYAIALTEDNVGPYSQSNYYAGGARGPMGGFESKTSPVDLMYNDVARRIYNWNGAKNCFPVEVKAGEPYIYKRNFSTSDLTNLQNSHVNVLLIDRNTGEIVTGTKFSLADVAGVDKVNTGEENITISASYGFVNIDGNYDYANVYALDGTLRASAQNEGSIAVAPGMYIVKVFTNGQSAVAKVVVK